jgi:hypothetical protein
MDLFRGAVATVFLCHFTGLGGSFAKLIGGLVSSFVVIGLLLLVFGGTMHRWLVLPAYRRPKTTYGGRRL